LRENRLDQLTLLFTQFISVAAMWTGLNYSSWYIYDRDLKSRYSWRPFYAFSPSI